MADEGRDPGKAVLEALTSMIRRESGRSEPEVSTGPTPRQAFVVILVSVDLVLLVALVPDELLEHRLIELAAHVVPAVMGGALLVYFERIRRKLFEWADRIVFRRTVMICAVPLALVTLGTHLPLFGYPVYLENRQLRLVVDGRPPDLEDIGGTRLIRSLSFEPHDLVVGHATRDGQHADTLRLLRRDLVRALPGLRRLLRFSTARLAPRYPVAVERSAGGALEIRGDFTPLFLREARLDPRWGLQPMRERDVGWFLVYQIPSVDGRSGRYHGLKLPPGEYDFVFRTDDNCEKHVTAFVRPESNVLGLDELSADCDEGRDQA